MGLGGDDDQDGSGLAALLQPEEKPQHVVASSSCQHDTARVAFESTIQHCLDLPPTDSAFAHKRSQPLNLGQLLDARLASFEDVPGGSGSGRGSAPPGRLGPAEVGIDPASSAGSFSFGAHDLYLESLTNFSSCRASAAVFGGKWQYECTVHTAGIQQIGWATIHCPFTPEEGVGDAHDSYAYDGGRRAGWLGGVGVQQPGCCCLAPRATSKAAPDPAGRAAAAHRLARPWPWPARGSLCRPCPAASTLHHPHPRHPAPPPPPQASACASGRSARPRTASSGRRAT
jgi:hypothetical protein